MATRYGPRPALGELTEGQPVIVRRSPNDSRGRAPGQRHIPARVTNVARVWVTIEGTEDSQYRPAVWRMRKDRQDEGSKYSGSNASFATLEQHAWDEAQSWALATLRDHGIDLRHSSPWRGRETELADIISKATQDATREDNGS